MAAPFSFAPRFLTRPPSAEARGARTDLDALLDRMSRRLYPESLPVLASYWLKTVYRAGHKRAWWQQMHKLLQDALRGDRVTERAKGPLGEIRTWIEQNVLHAAKMPAAADEPEQPFRPALRPERLEFYLCRLLNQWLPAEIARLLVDAADTAIPLEDGIPALAVGRALERLLVRERLPRQTLEALLDPKLVSVETAYPADVEIFRDVVLSMLGRTEAPSLSAMPATLLAVAGGVALPGNYRDAVGRAALVRNQGVDELQVPITPAQALHILTADPVRMGSLIVTADGRLWESENLQSGERHIVIYRSKRWLRIDNSADRARLHLPWPETNLYWEGAVHLPVQFELFGREWHSSSLETDGQRSVLHLVSARSLPLAEMVPDGEDPDRRSRPAAVDMAWAELREALAAAVFAKSLGPVEELHRTELIALGRAIFGLAESAHARFPKREALETHLKAVRYHEAEIAPVYGRVPWKVLPPQVQRAVLKRCSDAEMLALCAEVFDQAPEFHPHSSQAA